MRHGRRGCCFNAWRHISMRGFLHMPFSKVLRGQRWGQDCGCIQDARSPAAGPLACRSGKPDDAQRPQEILLKTEGYSRPLLIFGIARAGSGPWPVESSPRQSRNRAKRSCHRLWQPRGKGKRKDAWPTAGADRPGDRWLRGALSLHPSPLA